MTTTKTAAVQDYELDAWLGDAEVTDEQRDRLRGVLSAIHGRYPVEVDEDEAVVADDLRQERELASQGAVEVVLGDATLAGFGRARDAVRQAERDAMHTLTGAILASIAAGVPEAQIAREAGVDRMTVRKIAGK